MAIKASEYIWYNGKLIPWEDAKLHVMAHVINYGSSMFEGIRCYHTAKGPAIFRLRDHMQRLLDSCKIYRIDVEYSLDELCQATVNVVGKNAISPCYIRPIVLRGYGQVGVNPFNSPIDVYVVNYEWGKYLGDADADEGVDVCVSSWSRLAPNTMPTMAKSGANYMNSQLIKMEAIVNGYAEGIALDVNGYVSEGSGENVFVVHKGRIYTPPLGNSVLPGITRNSVLHIAHELRNPGDRADHTARDALHLRRTVLQRHRGRDHAHPFGRQDHRGQRRHRAGYQGHPQRVLWDRERHCGRPFRLADAGSGEAAGDGVIRYKQNLYAKGRTSRPFRLRIARAYFC